MPFRSVVFDVDGTLVHGDEPIPGAPEVVDRLRETGLDVLLFSNNPTRTPAEYADSVISLVEDYGYETGTTGCDPQALLSAMRHDKKRRGGRLNLVLQEGFGWTNVQEVPEGLVREVLEAVG